MVLLEIHQRLKCHLLNKWPISFNVCFVWYEYSTETFFQFTFWWIVLHFLMRAVKCVKGDSGVNNGVDQVFNIRNKQTGQMVKCTSYLLVLLMFSSFLGIPGWHRLQLRLSDTYFSPEHWLLLFESYELFSTCIPLHASNYRLVWKSFVVSGNDVSLYFPTISFGLMFIPVFLQNCTFWKEVAVLL